MCIHLFAGNQYLWGNIANYIVSYFHFQGDSNATVKISFLVRPISTTSMIIFGSLGSFLIKKFNVTQLMIAGSIMQLGGLLAASYVKSWWLFVILYSVVWPMGAGIVYWPAIICSWEWFPKNKGMITGFIAGAYGLGAFIFSFLTSYIVNPDNLSPVVPNDGTGTTDKLFPLEVANRVPLMIRTCLVCWACLCLLAICLVSRKPEYQLKQQMSRLEIKTEGDLQDIKKGENMEKDEPVTIKEAISSWRFYH